MFETLILVRFTKSYGHKERKLCFAMTNEETWPAVINKMKAVVVSLLTILKMLSYTPYLIEKQCLCFISLRLKMTHLPI